MMSSKKKIAAEPTLHDVMGMLVNIDKRVDGVEQRVNKGFNVLNQRINTLDDRLGVIDRRLGKVEVTVLEIQDDLESSFKAIDKDSEKIINHERRIRRLEKVVAT